MEIMHTHDLREAIRCHRISHADVIAVVAAVLSLLTFTLLLPGGLHFPW